MDENDQPGDPTQGSSGRPDRPPIGGSHGKQEPDTDDRHRATIGRPPNTAVRAAKRKRAKAAFIERVATVGYQKTRIKDICHDLHISNRDWYSWFGKKEPTYLVLFESCGDKVFRRAERGFAGTDGPWETRMRAALEVVTADLAAQPLVARFLVQCLHVEGGSAALAQLLVRAQGVYLTEEIRTSVSPIPEAALESIASSVLIQPMVRYLELDQLDRLPELVPSILYSLTLHLLGSERAAPLLPNST